MSLTRIAAAQSASLPGDIQANLDRHLRFARAAAAEAVSLLVFPELSLTGYELDLLEGCVLTAEDPRLAPLLDFCERQQLTMVVGALVPPLTGSKPAIGALGLGPNGARSIYRKRFLHAGEDVFASPGNANTCCLELKAERVALAICADTVHAEHPRRAKEAGATVYAAGVLWSRQGYAADAALMQAHAVKHGLAVLAANHAAPTGGFDSAGKSALWRPDGELLCAAPAAGCFLVIAEAREQEWLGSCVAVDI